MFYPKYEELCLLRGIKPCSEYAAKQLGVHKSNISYWKAHPKTIPEMPVLIAAAKMLGVSAAEFLPSSVVSIFPEQKPEPVASITLDDFTYAMHSEGKTLTEEDKTLLLSMAKQLNAARKARHDGTD